MYRRIAFVFFTCTTFTPVAFCSANKAKEYLKSKEYTEALAEVSGLADIKDSEALLVLYRIFVDGLGVKPDQEKAIQYLKKAAETAPLDSQVKIGLEFMLGEKIPPDTKFAFEIFSKTAAQGSAEGQFYLARWYMSESDPNYTKANEWLLKSAEQNFVLAVETIATNYLFGRGVPKQSEKAIEWMERAANLGSVEAMTYVAEGYRQRAADKSDLEKSIFWFKQAAEKGDHQSYFTLGYLYDQGKDVPRDLAKAIEYYRLGADKGFYPCQMNLGSKYLSGEGVSQNYEKAMELYKKAARQGEKNAFSTLGGMYEKGQGITSDPVLALAYTLVAINLDSEKPSSYEKDKESRQTKLNSVQIKEATQLSNGWKVGQPLPDEARSAAETNLHPDIPKKKIQ